MVKKHRGIVMSRKGMVSSAHQLISAAGLSILKKGGNAVDAAIAMANVSGVVLPDMCGLGGDAFMLYYDAKTKKVTAINGSGGAPKKASIEYFKTNGHNRVPKDGMLSVTVPGAVSVYFTALEKFGTMKFEDLIDDAVDLARNGVPVSEKVSRHMRTDKEKLLKYEGIKKLYLNKDGEIYNPGELIYNLDYADSLEYLAKTGVDGFYKLDIANKIVEHSYNKGGLFEIEDFINYKCDICEPIFVNYRDYIVFQTPPVSQGIIHLEELNILNQFDLELIKNTPGKYIHTMVEAKKIAFSDRVKYFGDPDFVKNPTKEILSYDYGKKVSSYIKEDSCLNTFVDLVSFDEFGHTTSMVAVDKDGNAVSFIHSISATWGSGEVVEGTGILLNNRAGTGFNLIEGHPNGLRPTKKTMHTLNTYLITDREFNLKWIGNTPGGDNQPQWNMQVVTNVIDFGMDVQTAVEAPKWTDAQSSNPHGDNIKNVLTIESSVGEEAIEYLKNLGHELNVIEPYGCSGASQIIEVRDNGVLFGGSDPRADGCAMGE